MGKNFMTISAIIRFCDSSKIMRKSTTTYNRMHETLILPSIENGVGNMILFYSKSIKNTKSSI